MEQRGIPLLALALAAAACWRLRLSQEDEARLRVCFTEAVLATDSADSAYRGAIEQTLPPDKARTMLRAMASFREMAQQTREAAVRELEQIWKRYQLSYGWFDPLDAYAPPASGLNHADATRAATIADRARAQVDALRNQANQSVLGELSAEQIEALRAAKLRRRDRFRTALALAFRNAVDTPIDQTRFDALLDQLTSLTEGWY